LQNGPSAPTHPPKISEPKMIERFDCNQESPEVFMSAYQKSVAVGNLESGRKIAGRDIVLAMKLISIWLVVMLAMLSYASFAPAQQKKTFTQEDISARYFMVEEPSDPEDELSAADRNTNKTARANRNKDRQSVQGILESGGDLKGAAISGYFNDYIFAEMTQPEWLSEAGSNRDGFFRYYLSSRMSKAQRKAFIEDIMIPMLGKRIQDDSLFPAARVNAVVLLGLADDQALDRISDTPPQPNMKALQALVSIFKGDAYPDYLKISALAGMYRHVSIDTVAANGRIAADARRAMVNDVLASMDQAKKDDPDLTDDLNYWKTRRGIQFLAAAKVQGQANAIFDRVAAYVGQNSKAPTWVKLDAVKAMKTLPLDGVDQQKIGTVIESAIAFLAESLESEATSIETAVNDLVYDNILLEDVDLEHSGTNYSSSGGMGGGGGMFGGMGGGGGDDDDDEDERGGGGMGAGPGMGGGMGPGMGGGMGPGGGRGGNPFGGGDDEEPIEPIVELPNYELNQIRRRIKVLTFSVNDALTSDESSIKKAAPAKQLTLIGKLSSPVKRLMEGSNIGVRDMMADKEDEEPQTKSYATQLKEVCEKGAGDLLGVIGQGNEAAPAEAPAAAGGQPANTPFDDGAGN
jgi:hypothetical protein